MRRCSLEPDTTASRGVTGPITLTCGCCGWAPGSADPCQRSQQCSFIQEKAEPQEADLDLALVLDGSREVPADQFAGAQQLLGSVVAQLAVSPQPRRPGTQTRVAALQQGQVAFDLQTYQNQGLMRRHLVQNMRQLGGSSALGDTLDLALNQLLLKAIHPRQRRLLFAVVGTQVAQQDAARLRAVAQKARCEGVALFVVTVGTGYDRTEVEELASAPVPQHLVHVGGMKAEEQAYVCRFFRVFVNALNSKPRPPPAATGPPV